MKDRSGSANVAGKESAQDCDLPAKLEAARVSPGSGNRFLRALAIALGVSILAVVAYSIDVATRDPDPQEVVILGQAKLASDAPAGLRVLVRHRTSLAPVPQAKVDVHLASNSVDVVALGAFKTDASGCLTEPVEIPKIAPGQYPHAVGPRAGKIRQYVRLSPLGRKSP